MIHYFYPKEMLPSGFIYPSSFLEFISKKEIPDLDPWWFIYEFEELSKKWFLLLKKQYPTRNVVPFAKASNNDDIACFDGTDKSGDPKIFIIHSFASPGWEDRGSVKNFNEWLELTKKESAQYKLECTEGYEG